MASEHWKKDKICPVCGETFKGTAKAQVCGSTCRSRLKRLLEAGGKPEFILIAKGKGQKIPDLNASKGLVFRKSEKRIINQDSKVLYIEPMPEVFDGAQVKNITLDEIGLFPQPEMTKEQIIEFNSELDKKIGVIKKEGLPPGMMPRAHILNKEIRIDELQQLKKQIN